MPHFYRTPDEFVAAAQSVVTGATARQPVGILAVEVDPPDGDDVTPSALGGVAEIVRYTGREEDLVGLLGDRLVMVLPSSSSEDGRVAGERLAAAVRMHDFGVGRGRTTVSVGAASAPEHGNSFEAVHDWAERALHRIQSQGRDGAGAAPLPHHEPLHRPLAIDRFAGRAAEFTQLLAWLDDACAGHPRLVSITGESGAGAATLAHQLESEVRLRGGVFVSVTSPNIAVPRPYGAWQSLLHVTHRFPSAPERAWHELPYLERGLQASEDAGHTGSQYRLLGELTEYVRALAADRPLVLLLDEMQWADSTTWDALEHLLSHVDHDKMLILLTSRPDAAFDLAPYHQMLARFDLTRQLAISRLTRDEVKQWLEAVFHRQVVAREFLAFLYRHTEGNPFFIAQLLRVLIEEGAIWHNGTRWEWSPVSELRLPAGRWALLAHRLARFSASTQAVLATAAVVGRAFDVSLLVGAGAGSEPAVRLAVTEALAAGLLRASDERQRGGFAFVHDEIADVVMSGITRRQLEQTHQRVAQAFERQQPDRLGEIALHYDAAGEPADAYRTAQLAAKAAERVYAPGSAGAYLQVAARNATSPAELAEVRVALTQVAETGGRYDEVEELCDLTIEWFEGQGDAHRTLRLRRTRERARMEQGQPARVTLEALSKLSDEAVAIGDERERVALLMMASQTYGRLGDQRKAVSMAHDSVAAAEALEDRALMADAFTRLGIAVVAESPSDARRPFAEALRLFEEIGDVRGQARSYNHLGIAATFEARLDDARSAFTRAITVGRAAGVADVWGLASQNLGVLCQKRGEYDRARALFGDALSLFAAVKNSEYQLAALYNMAQVEHELGLWESAVELFDTTIPLAQRIGQSDIEIGATAGLGLCRLELGHVDRARSALAQVSARIQGRPEWFQGREIAEAFAVRMDALDGRLDDALRRFDRAVLLAEATDFYNAAWLTVACADTLMNFAPDRVKLSVDNYGTRVRDLGYPEMTRRFEALASA